MDPGVESSPPRSCPPRKHAVKTHRCCSARPPQWLFPAGSFTLTSVVNRTAETWGFALLVSLVQDHVNRSSKGETFSRLQSFCLPDSTPSSEHFQAFRYLVASMVVERSRVLTPSVGIAVALVRMRAEGAVSLAYGSSLSGRVGASGEAFGFAGRRRG